MDLKHRASARLRSRGATHWSLVMLACVGPTTAAAQATACADLAAAAWLAGTWLAERHDTLVTEAWAYATTTTLEGRGVARARADGTLRDAEDLRLLAMGDGVFYVAKVAHNDFPVAFRMTACDDGHLVFENATHDFPRRIEYRRLDAARMEVHVSDGASRGFRLDFRRQSAP